MLCNLSSANGDETGAGALADGGAVGSVGNAVTVALLVAGCGAGSDSACAARLVRTTVSVVTLMIWFAGGGSTRVCASARDRSDNPLAVLTTGCGSLLLCHDFQKNQPDSPSDDITRSP